MIEFHLLGSVDLKGPEGTLRSVLAQPKRVALLAYLAVARPDGFHRRDKVLGLFWPESDQEHGRGALRKALYFLRQSLGEEMIVSRGDEEIGLAEGVLWCDAVAFEAALEAGKPEEALEVYRGGLLDGFYVAEAPEFERWLDGERERLRSRAAEAAWTLVDEAETAGNGVEAAKWARKAVGFSPNDEAAFRRLLELLGRLGDRTGAIKEYEAFARRSQEEYEAEPSPETQALIAAIREREVAAAAGSPERPAESPAGVARAVSPEPIAVTPRPEQYAERRPASLLRVLATYGLVSLAVLLAVHIFTLQLGLPDWFFPSAVVVLLVCLPIIVATALVQGAAFSARRAGAEARVPSAAARRWLTWRNAISVTVVALAVLGLAVAGYMAARLIGIGPWGTLIAEGVLEERDVIVLADFADHTGDSTLALTVTEAFRVDLEQSAVVRVADRSYVGRVLRRMEREPDTPLTHELACEVAVREGLKAVVAGAINRAGSGYVLSARLVAAETRQTLSAFFETAAGPDAIMTAIDQLSNQLRERIGESLKTVRSSRPLRASRTASLEALRLYTEASNANAGLDRVRALDLVSRAIEIDTTFAEAYRLRSVVLSNLRTQRARRIADVIRAYELRHRLPLEDQYWIESSYHFEVTGDMEKRIRALEALLELGPTRRGRRLGALNNIGVSYIYLRQNARAEEVFHHICLESESNAPIHWSGLFMSQMNQGKFDSAEETLERWEAKRPEHAATHRWRAWFASAQGDYDSARAHLKRLRDLRRVSRLERARFNVDMGRLAQVEGKLAEAEGYFLDAMPLYEEGDNPVGYIAAGRQLAGLRLWFQGDTIRALETMAAALERHPLDSIEPLERPYMVLAGFYAFAGAPARARELLLEWETVFPPDLRRPIIEELSRRLNWGAVALAERRAEEALADLRIVHGRAPSPIVGVPMMGRAYELSGQPDSAVVMYERYLTTPSYVRALWGTSPAGGRDPYWLPVAYERLGDLYEQRGDTAKAIYYYGKLVDLWKDADAELQPRVEAARRAIQALSPDT